ncbi:hypothetical protein [Mesobacillus thioparans]
MKELVGICDACGKEIFCMDGFLNGIHDNGKLLCFECEKNTKEDS